LLRLRQKKSHCLAELRRRVVVSNPPFTATLGDQHRKARWRWYGLALLHPSKFVKPRDQRSIVIDRDGAPFLDRILVAASL